MLVEQAKRLVEQHQNTHAPHKTHDAILTHTHIHTHMPFHASSPLVTSHTHTSPVPH
jgi:hypothetical protein